MKSFFQWTKNLMSASVNRIFAYLILNVFLLSQIIPSAYTLNQDTGYTGEQVIQIPQTEKIVEQNKIQTAEKPPTILRYQEVTLEIPDGALATPVDITVEKLTDIEKLNPGMFNVTGGAFGYRFKPDGLQFLKEVKVSIPYDKSTIDDPIELANLYTFFYNTQTHLWERLAKVGIDQDKGIITSITTHFTDMINSTLTLPESPGPLSFNPNSIKDIKAANPSQNIPQIKGLEGGPFGAAQFSLPLTIPSGRNGLTPQLSLDYNSQTPNGWLGVGFDINIPAITIDTKFGVPNYDGNDIYLLNGQELVFAENNGSDALYRSRVEGNFLKIVRKGTNAANYYFEITSKDGTCSTYGTGDAVLQSYRGNNGIFYWYLKEIRDTRGNKVIYHYSQDNASDGSEPWRATYLSSIEYTAYQDEPGKYLIQFINDSSPRSDIQIDARGKFQHRIRYRLKEIRVLYDNQLIRKYVLDLAYNDFNKTILIKISELDANGNEFYAYSFNYYEMPKKADGFDGFKQTESWGVDNYNDFSAMNTTQTIGGGGSVYVGLGWDFNLSFGANIGFQLDFSNDLVNMLDINGDGLTDQVLYTPAGVYVRLNTGNGFTGAMFFDSVQALINFAFQFNFNFGIAAGFGPISASAGASFGFANGYSTIADINGDGFVDIIPAYSNSYLKGRGTDGFKWEPWRADIPPQAFDLDTGLDNVEHMNDLDSSYHLIDAVRKWEPYHRGTVTVSGTVTKIDDPRAVDEYGNLLASDGVRVNIYQNNTSLLHNIQNRNLPYWEAVYQNQNIIDQSILLKNTGENYTYQADATVDTLNDRLYFKANSVKSINNDLIQWSPEIAYKTIQFHDNLVNYYPADPSADPVYYSYAGKLLTVRKQDISYYITRDASADIDPQTIPAENADMVGQTSDKGILAEVVRQDGQLTAKKWIKETGTKVQVIIEDASGDTVKTANVDPGYTAYHTGTTVDSLIVTETLSGKTRAFTLINDNTEDTSYDVIYKQLKVYDQYIYPVTVIPYPGNITEDTVRDAGHENKGTQEKTSYILQEDFDTSADTIFYKQYIHVFSGKLDFAPVNLVDSQNNPQDTGEYFNGGVYNWYYGEWNGNYEWDESLIGTDTKEAMETRNFCYFSAMAKMAQDEEDNYLGVDLWRGSEFKYEERRYNAAGEKIEIEKYFADYISYDQVNPSRKGGDSKERLPAGKKTIQLGGIAGDVRNSLNFGVNANASVAGIGGALSLGFSQGYKDLFDLNGDRYPDQVFLPMGSTTLLGLMNNRGGGFDRRVDFNNTFPLLRHSFNTSVGIGITPGAVGSFIKFMQDPGGQTRSAEPNQASRASISASFNGTLGESATDIDFMDINGDGLVDHVYRNTESDLKVKLNLGDTFSNEMTWASDGWTQPVLSSFDKSKGPNFIRHDTMVSAGFNFGVGTSQVGVSAAVNISGNRTKVEFFDINGDGLADEVFKLHQNDYFSVRLNEGNRFGDVIKWYTPSWQYLDGQYNGFAIDNYVENIVENIVNAAMSSNGSKAGGDYNKIDIDFDQLNLGQYTNDINILGAGDVISYSGNIGVSISANFTIDIGPLGPTFLHIYITPGGNFAYSLSSAQLQMTDIDGDGLADHVFKYGPDAFFRVKKNNAAKVGLLKQITEPLGATIDLEYERTHNSVNMPNSQYVLSRVTRHDGTGNSYPVSYNYHDSGYYDRNERSFYGFSAMTVTQPDGSRIINQYSNSTFYNKGLLVTSETQDANGKIYNKSLNIYDLDTYQFPGSKAAVFPALAETRNFMYDTQTDHSIQSAFTYQYDSYGNVIRAVDKGEYTNPDDDVFIEIQYDYNTSGYIIANPKLLLVQDKNSNILRKRTGAYNTYGDLIRLEQFLLGASANPVSTLDYDAYGNLIKVTDPKGYYIQYEYDPAVHTYMIRINDTFGYESTAVYDYRFGVDTHSTDTNRNGMDKTYDAFGRLTGVFTAYDAAVPAVEFFYYPGQFPAKAVTKNKIHFDPADTETLDTVIFIDGLRRVIQTKKEGEILLNGDAAPTYGMNVAGKVIYDNMGRIQDQGQPVFQSGYNLDFWNAVPLNNPTHNEYDILGRVLRTTLPDNSQISNSYRVEDCFMKTAVTDPNGKQKISYVDIDENIVKIEQFNQGETIITRYEYNLLNEITAVIDHNNNATHITYDSLGRRTSIDNPDSGLVNYTYDLSGNLVQKTDNNLRAKNQAVNYIYEYNRLLTIDYPVSTDVQYEYGAPGADNNRAGRIKKITDESGTVELFYGKLGEEIKNIKTLNFGVPGQTPWTFTSESGFDYLGRMQWVKYPDGEKLVYQYDRGGQIKSAYGERGADLYYYVKNIYYDEFGQRIYIKYGNDVATRYTYNPQRRWLANIQTQNNSGTSFQNINYNFDAVGNILGIQNTAKNITQTFQYDDLYQLVRADGSSPVKNKINTYSQQYTYDKIGNMTHKISTNLLTPGNTKPKELNYDFTYLYNSAKPHAATQIGEWQYDYDANGNTVKKTRLVNGNPNGGGVEGEYFWNEENRLTRASINGNDTVFLYNTSGERTLKRGQHGESLYVSQYYQLQDKQQVTKHIFIGNTRMVTKLSHYSNTGGLYDEDYERNNIYTYHPDHLGSSNYITDPYGNEFEHIEYTPYGESWVEEGTNLNIIGYKFTSKELDTETGLYYFGARYLDPMTSRWMSADPDLEDYIPKIDESIDNLPSLGGIYNFLNLNLYHYSNNNPIIYLDPNGDASILARDIRWYNKKTGVLMFSLKNSHYNVWYNYKGVNVRQYGSPDNDLAGRTWESDFVQNTFDYIVLYSNMDDNLMNKVSNDLLNSPEWQKYTKEGKKTYNLGHNCQHYALTVYKQYMKEYKDKLLNKYLTEYNKELMEKTPKNQKFVSKKINELSVNEKLKITNKVNKDYLKHLWDTQKNFGKKIKPNKDKL